MSGLFSMLTGLADSSRGCWSMVSIVLSSTDKKRGSVDSTFVIFFFEVSFEDERSFEEEVVRLTMAWAGCSSSSDWSSEQLSSDWSTLLLFSSLIEPKMSPELSDASAETEKGG